MWTEAVAGISDGLSATNGADERPTGWPESFPERRDVKEPRLALQVCMVATGGGAAQNLTGTDRG